MGLLAVTAETNIVVVVVVVVNVVQSGAIDELHVCDLVNQFCRG